MSQEIPKVDIVPNTASEDGSAATYRIHEESHTLGNALRWMLMKNPKVEFCGYSVPHPSENFIHVRVQMYDGFSSTDAFATALDDLENVFDTIEEKYDESLKSGKYETWVEKS
ncbi:RBP11-like subunits of RNA polymerase [Cylindrobasidium torrendii FP15055 ss-10]|uniref:DNA-directed RNA polymerases I and III subunit RPAC2 n=1 Tax=Cylindrobasidium torrendii FP15055 ss-10 TaxID=1314674 RepID=A0A0D7B4X0_9AGAR|nr:RBP11-like subunits of RNA polymerase [Cylindrobasidium torrendii FP15055 ss-10]